MKNFIRFIALSTLVSLPLVGWSQDVAPAAPAAAPVEQKQCCPSDCASVCHWKMPHFKDWYTDVYGLYSTAHKFHGWGIGFRFGKFFNHEDTLEADHKGHAYEFEFDWIHETAHTCKYNAGTGLLGSGSDEARTVKVDMFPLMVNYRYHGSMAGWSECKWLERLRWSLGAGLGLNIFHYKDKQTITTTYSVPGAYDIETGNWSKTSIKLAFQLFGDIRYACTERVEMFTGIRGFFTDDHKFGHGTQTPLKVGKVHGIWDFGVNWMW